jgi:hypothetical protein
MNTNQLFKPNSRFFPMKNIIISKLGDSMRVVGVCSVITKEFNFLSFLFYIMYML